MAQKKRETLLQSQRRKLAEQRAAKAVADAARDPQIQMKIEIESVK